MDKLNNIDALINLSFQELKVEVEHATVELIKSKTKADTYRWMAVLHVVNNLLAEKTVPKEVREKIGYRVL